MTRRSRIWLVLALLFVLVNLAGGIYAAMMREGMHATIHFVLFALALPILWMLAPAGQTFRSGRRATADDALPGAFTDRLSHLEQSVDAVAIEVERIGEGQRFMTKVFTDDGPSRKSVERGAQALEVNPEASTPDGRRS